jgi:hypothetical protein
MLYGYPGACRFAHATGFENGIIEFPISTALWGGFTVPFGGGFYFRSWPYWFLRLSVRQLNNQGHPAVLYFHPWELDTDQHYDQVTPRERLTHYYGRRSLMAKLERLFTEFQFAPLCKFLEKLKLSDTEIYS